MPRSFFAAVSWASPFLFNNNNNTILRIVIHRKSWPLGAFCGTKKSQFRCVRTINIHWGLHWVSPPRNNVFVGNITLRVATPLFTYWFECRIRDISRFNLKELFYVANEMLCIGPKPSQFIIANSYQLPHLNMLCIVHDSNGIWEKKKFVHLLVPTSHGERIKRCVAVAVAPPVSVCARLCTVVNHQPIRNLQFVNYTRFMNVTLPDCLTLPKVNN